MCRAAPIDAARDDRAHSRRTFGRDGRSRTVQEQIGFAAWCRAGFAGRYDGTHDDLGDASMPPTMAGPYLEPGLAARSAAPRSLRTASRTLGSDEKPSGILSRRTGTPFNRRSIKCRLRVSTARSVMSSMKLAESTC